MPKSKVARIIPVIMAHPAQSRTRTRAIDEDTERAARHKYLALTLDGRDHQTYSHCSGALGPAAFALRIVELPVDS